MPLMFFQVENSAISVGKRRQIKNPLAGSLKTHKRVFIKLTSVVTSSQPLLNVGVALG